MFQFDHGVRCDCGAWVTLDAGHVAMELPPGKERAEMAEQEIGKVAYYFGKIRVAAIELTQGSFSVGDTIHIKGHTTDFMQPVDAMQFDNASVPQASPGQSIRIKVADHAREHDVVYKVTA